MRVSLYRVAVISEVFYDDPEGERLHERLWEAKLDDAKLAVLPELPLDRWCPATRTPSPEDAEEPGGRRHQLLSHAAREVGIALIAGAIVVDADGARHNTGLLFDASGVLAASYRKVHLPEEEGFWETSHYVPGTDPPAVVRGVGPALGFQICSDINRPAGAQLLAAQGVEVICAPRCTPVSSYDRWRLVYRAAAVTSCAYVISPNRPGPEAGVPIGGASLVAGPDGTVVEARDPVSVVALDMALLRELKRDYPGYLTFQPELYARGWEGIRGSVH